MTRRLPTWIVDAVLLALTLLVVWETGSAMVARLGADFDLEWMEGATLVTGLRAREGLPFYTVPDADYVPFIYPPVYAWTLGLLGKALPLGYALGRGVSVLGTLVACAALVSAARWAGARMAVAFASAGLFLACWAEGGTFYDLVRVDMLALAPLAWALVLGVRPGRRWALVSGLLLAAAFAVKHHAALFGVPLALVRWRREGAREALAFTLASALPALAFVGAMHLATDGLFLRYLLEVPAHHGIVAERALPSVGKVGLLAFDEDAGVRLTVGPFLEALAGPKPLGGAQVELWKALPITTTLAVGALAWRGVLRDRAYWGGVFLVAVIVASLMRGHVGGYLNVLIPCFWVQALLPALVGAAPAAVETADTPDAALAARAWLPLVTAALMAAQLWQGRDPLARYVPTPEDARAHAALVAEVRALPGRVWVPHAPWLAVQAGKGEGPGGAVTGPALIALWDIDHEGGPFLDRVARVRRAVEDGRWDVILTPDDKLRYGLRDHYVRATWTTTGPSTRTGWPVRIRMAWRPRDAAQGT